MDGSEFTGSLQDGVPDCILDVLRDMIRRKQALNLLAQQQTQYYPAAGKTLRGCSVKPRFLFDIG